MTVFLIFHAKSLMIGYAEKLGSYMSVVHHYFKI